MKTVDFVYRLSVPPAVVYDVNRRGFDELVRQIEAHGRPT
jgi:hypothetical protein